MRLFLVLTVFTLSGCEFYREASPEDISRAVYSSAEPASITLISMVKNRDDRSAHSALLINGSQQVLYDPAGTFQHPDLPRSGDIHYGVTPRFLDYYEKYHARFSHYVQSQTVEVDQATANRILANAQAKGKSPKMFCAVAVADVINSEDPFRGVNVTMFPEGLRRDFAEIPGVQDSFVYEYDEGQNRAWETETAAVN
ncbi:hypothetical protein [Amaricoccus tamworthensis]|uniref:hypothetical protein n=1 Tax=Amaricoccus tamworthensis TaxID=57002 RepID=UPI003C7BA2D7